MRTLIAFFGALLVAGHVAAQPPEPAAPPSHPEKTPAETRIEELERQLRELGARVVELEGEKGEPSAEPADGAAAEPQAWPPSRSRPGRVAGVPDRADFRLLDFHLNRPDTRTRCLISTACPPLQPQLQRSSAVRRRARGRARAGRGLEESGELELSRLISTSGSTRVQHPGGNDPGAGRHHQRAARTASFHGVERPFVDTVISDDLVRRGRRRSRRLRGGWRYRAYPWPARRHKITAEEGLAEARQKGFSRTSATSRRPRARVRGSRVGARHELLAGQSGFNFRREDARVGVVELTGATTRTVAIRGEFATSVGTPPS